MSAGRNARRIAAVVPVVAVLLSGSPFVGSAAALQAPATVPGSNAVVNKSVPFVSATFDKAITPASRLVLTDKADAVIAHGGAVENDKTIKLALTGNLSSTQSPYTVEVVATPVVPDDTTPYQGSWQFSIDDTAPTLTLTNTPPAQINTNTITIAGTTNEKGKVRLTVARPNVAPVEAEADVTGAAGGSFQFANVDISALGDGALTATVVAIDDYANNSAPEVATFTKDVAAPALTLTTKPAARINSNTITIAGTTSEASDVVLTVQTSGNPTTVTGSRTLAAAGSFEFGNVDLSTLLDGALVATVVATDLHGNATTVTASFTKDVAAPVLTLTQTPPAATPGPITIAGTTSEAGDVDLTVQTSGNPTTVTDSATLDAAGSFEFGNVDLGTLLDGAVVATVVATDLHGNATTMTASFTKDTVAPARAVNGTVPADGTTSQTRTTVEVTFTEPLAAGSGLKVRNAFGSELKGSVTFPTDNKMVWTGASPLTEAGSGYTVIATATDLAGHSSTTTSTFAIDVTAPGQPTVSLTNPINEFNVTKVIVSGVAEQNADVDVLVKDTAGGTVQGRGKALPNGDYWIEVDVSSLVDGPVTATARAADAALNVGDWATTLAESTLDVDDPSAPSVTISDPIAADRIATVSGTVTSNQGATEVDITVDDLGDPGTQPVTKTVVLAAGSDAFTTTLTLAGLNDGQITASAVARDAAGNKSDEGSDTAQLDTGLPEVTELSMPTVNDANKGAVTATGKTEPNLPEVVVTVSDGTTTTSSPPVTSGPDGAFEATFNTTFPEMGQGMLTVTAVAKDGAGNASAPKTIQVLRDTELPGNPTVVMPDWVNAGTQDEVEITGTGELGSELTITLTDANGLTATLPPASVAPTGDWQTTASFEDFGEGVVTASVRARDTAGNDSASAGTASTTKDSIAPIAPTVDLPDKVGPGNTVVEGTSEVGSNVVVLIDDADGTTTAVPGEGEATGTAPALGSYSFAVDLSPLKDGPLTATAIATDDAGNPSAQGTMQDPATKDTTTLAKTATSPADGAIVSPPAKLTVTFNEPLHATTTIRLLDRTGGEVNGTERVDGNTVSFAPSDALPDAASVYTVEYTAKDAGQNDTASGSFTFTVDSKAPAKPTVALPLVNAENDDAVKVDVGAESGSKVAVTVTDVNGASLTRQPTEATPGAYSVVLDLRDLAEGALTATAVATDDAGNASEPGLAATVKDTVAPASPGLSLPAFVNDENKGSVPATGTKEPGASVLIRVVDGSGGEYTKTVPADEHATFATTLALGGLGEGELTATAVATDAAVNPSEPKSATMTKDVGVPLAPESVELADPVNAGNVTRATVSGVAEAGSTVLISVDDTDDTTSPVVADPSPTAHPETGAFSTTVDLTALAPNTQVTATVRARDAAGNVSAPVSDTATKDAQVPQTPTVSFSGPANAASTLVTFTGTAEAGSDLTISVDDGDALTAPVSTTIRPESGTYSEQLDLAGLVDGPLTARVTTTDSVGNTSVVGTAPGLKDVVVPDPATNVTLADPVNADGQDAVAVSGVAEAGSTVLISVDDTDATTGPVVADPSPTADPETGAFSTVLDLTALAPNTQVTATVLVTDAAGNVSAAASDTATKDTTTPTPTVDLPDPINAEGQTKVRVSGVAEPGSDLAISVVDTAGAAKTATAEADATTGAYSSAELDVTDLKNGELTASVVATDWAGNVSATGTDTSTKDASLPDVPILTTPQAVTRASRAAAPFAGTAEPASKVTVAVDDADATTAAVSGTTDAAPDGTWSLSLELTSLRDGTLSIAVTATDAVLNSSTTSGSVAKDSTRAFTIAVAAAPTSGAEQTVTVTARSTYAIDSPVDTSYTGTPVLSSADGHTAAGTCTPAVEGVATCSGTAFGDLGSQTLRASEGSGEDLLEGASTVVVQPVALVFTVAPPATATPNQAVTFTVAPTVGVTGASIAGYSASRTLVTTGGSTPSTGTALACAEAACQVSLTFFSRGPKTVKVVDNGSPSLSTPTATVTIPYVTALSLYRSATTVNAGSQVLLAGDLLNTTTLHGVAGQRIELWRKVAPATTYSPVTSVRTDEDGVWFVALRVSKNTTYQVRYKGTATHLASASAGRAVKAAFVVSSTLSKSGRTVKVTGRVSPNAAGRPVYLQYRKSDGTWAYAGAQTKVSRTGTYTLSRTLSRGKWTLRAAASGTSVYASGYSRSLTTTIS